MHEILTTVEKDKNFLRGILKSTFFVERLDAVIDARESAVQFISTVLAENQKVDPDLAGTKAYTIVAAIGGVVETIIFRTDERISLNQLSEETTNMIVKYCS